MAEITSVILGSVSLLCNSVVRPRKGRFATHVIPGRSSPRTQGIAGISNTITLKGRLFGASKETDKDTLEGYQTTTPITYTDTDNGSLSVFVESVLIPHEAKTETTYRDFTIILRVNI